MQVDVRHPDLVSLRHVKLAIQCVVDHHRGPAATAARLAFASDLGAYSRVDLPGLELT